VWLKYRNGIKLAIGFGLIAGLAFAGCRMYTLYVILPKHYPRLTPGKVNLIGIRLSRERLVVSNGAVRLELGGDREFGSDQPQTEDDTSDEPIGSSKSGSVPMYAIIGALQMRPQDGSDLVSALAGLDSAEIPPKDLVWTAEDVRKALAGDPVLKPRLEDDLCQALDGGLLPRFRVSRIRSGIFIQLMVPIQVPSEGKPKTLLAPVVVPFSTELTARIRSNRQIQNKYQPSAATWRGVYEEEAANLQKGAHQSPAEQLKKVVDEKSIEAMGEPAGRLLSRIEVLSTEEQITSGTVETSPKPNSSGTYSTIRLSLTEEGRNRLWQYTFRHPGCQLLFVYDGVAIAAPFVESEMKYSTVAITNVTDEVTAREAVEWINHRTK